jgi:hypothetical protein
MFGLFKKKDKLSAWRKGLEKEEKVNTWDELMEWKKKELTNPPEDPFITISWNTDFALKRYAISPGGTADLDEAVALANEKLLGKDFDPNEVHAAAVKLHESCEQFSTCDLAACVALHFYINIPYHSVPLDQSLPLIGDPAQARNWVKRWAAEGKVSPIVASVFDGLMKGHYNLD